MECCLGGDLSLYDHQGGRECARVIQCTSYTNTLFLQASESLKLVKKLFIGSKLYLGPVYTMDHVQSDHGRWLVQ